MGRIVHRGFSGGSYHISNFVLYSALTTQLHLLNGRQSVVTGGAAQQAVLRAEGLLLGDVIEDRLHGVHLVAVRDKAEEEGKETDDEEDDAEEDRLDGRQREGEGDGEEGARRQRQHHRHQQHVLRQAAGVDEVREELLNVVQKRAEGLPAVEVA